MKKNVSIEFEREGITCSVDENIAILKIWGDAFQTIVDVDKDRDILEWFDVVENSPTVKGVLVINEKGSLGEELYNKFLSNISGQEIDYHQPSAITKFEKTHIRSIEINMFMNYIRRILEFKKVFISALQGEVVTPFFGMILATDMRFISDNTFFSLSHIKYSIHPSGALPFFLPMYIGYGRSMEYLLTGGRINSEKALQLNLVNRVFSENDFVEKSIAEAKRITQISPQYVKITKNLFYNFKKELERYFEQESNYLLS